MANSQRNSRSKSRNSNKSTPRTKNTSRAKSGATKKTPLPKRNLQDFISKDKSTPPTDDSPAGIPPKTLISPNSLTLPKDDIPHTPTITNNPVRDFENHSNETVKTSEKPPEPPPTYKEVLIENGDEFASDPSKMSTFLLQKRIHDSVSNITNVNDDDTVEHENFSSNSEFKNSIRMSMMFKVPTKKAGCSEEDAPMVAIKKMNEMIKSLTNKLPCRVGPWIMNQFKISLKEKDLLKILPENIDFVESYVYDYNRFISPGKTGYVRLRIYFSNLTSVSEIAGVTSQFKKPREQFFELAHSDATSPVAIGTLTGSVAAMATSFDFKEVMKTKFGLRELGLWYTQPRTSKSGEFSKDRFILHIEIDRKDLPKREEMEHYFNNSSASIDENFFGVQMLLVKPFNYFADDDVKDQIDKHARRQACLGGALRSTIITGVQLCNWSNLEKTSTLLRDLMEVESIIEKKVIKSKKATTFKGRVFYAIIPDKRSFTFYFTKANYHEGRSIARGLPLFIRDYFKLDPAFFCSSGSIAQALEGEWNPKTRTFLSASEKIEDDKLDVIESMALAEKDTFISKDQEAAMAMEDDNISIETRLTKNEAAPTLHNDDVSEMTGSTRESKAQAYADKAVKVVAAQYTDTIGNMQTDIGAKDNKIAQLELMLKKLKNGPSTFGSDENSSISTTENLPRFEKRQKEIDTPGRAKKQKASSISQAENKKRSSLEDDMSL